MNYEEEAEGEDPMERKRLLTGQDLNMDEQREWEVVVCVGSSSSSAEKWLCSDCALIILHPHINAHVPTESDSQDGDSTDDGEPVGKEMTGNDENISFTLFECDVGGWRDLLTPVLQQQAALLFSLQPEEHSFTEENSKDDMENQSRKRKTRNSMM